MTLEKPFEKIFDLKLVSDNIQYIDYTEYDEFHIRCDRCQAELKNVNMLEIDDKEYYIGNDCLNSIIRILSEIWGTSIRWVKQRIGMSRYVKKEYTTTLSDIIKTKNPDSEYSRYLKLKWDIEHGNPPEFIIEEFEKLRKKFKK